MSDVQYCKLCKKKHDFCDCCHIGIGQKHLEDYKKKVGDHILCGTCYGKLLKKGRIRLDPLGKTTPYLLANGKIREGAR